MSGKKQNPLRSVSGDAVGVGKERKSLTSRKEYNRSERAESVRERIADSQQLNQILAELKTVGALGTKFARIPRHRWTPEVKRKLDGLLSVSKTKLDKHLALLSKVCGDQRTV